MATTNALVAEFARIRSMSDTELAAFLAASAAPAPRSLTLKVSEKGGVSVYGLGRFPVTLYAASWERLLAPDQAKTILDFIATNSALVSRKGV